MSVSVIQIAKFRISGCSSHWQQEGRRAAFGFKPPFINMNKVLPSGEWPEKGKDESMKRGERWERDFAAITWWSFPGPAGISRGMGFALWTMPYCFAFLCQERKFDTAKPSTHQTFLWLHSTFILWAYLLRQGLWKQEPRASMDLKKKKKKKSPFTLILTLLCLSWQDLKQGFSFLLLLLSPPAPNFETIVSFWCSTLNCWQN